MLDDLKIDSTTLPHFDYHWFWGLRYSKAPQRVNFGVEVVALLNDEVKLAELIARQTKLYHEHNAVERYFYWLFNINNYTYQSYVLAACKGYQNYLAHTLEKEGSMPTTNKSRWEALTSALTHANEKIKRFFSPQTSAAFMKKADDEADDEVSANALVTRQEPSAAAAEASAAMPISQDVEAVMVTAAMQPHLAVLGINLQLGDSLKLADFKSSCKAQFLATHPDKGGSDEAFRSMKEAAEALRKIISSRGSSTELPAYEDNPAEYWAEFNASMAEVWANIAAAKADWAAAKADWAAARADMDVAKADWASADADWAAAKAAADAEKAAHEAWKIEMAAALQDLQEQEEPEEQSLASSSSFSATGAPGLFAPDSKRAEGQEGDKHAAASSPRCR